MEKVGQRWVRGDIVKWRDGGEKIERRSKMKDRSQEVSDERDGRDERIMMDEWG